MKRNYATLAICIATSTFAFGGNDTLHYSCSLFYANDDYRLNRKQQEQLMDFLKKKNDAFGFSIEINGYTDINGTDNYNQVLSQKRANEVFDFIKQNSVSAKSISQFHFGERFAKNDSDKSVYGQYRRVDVELEVVPYNNNTWLQSLSPTTIQHTTFYTDTEYTIKGKFGSIIEIPRNAFVDSNGQAYNGTVSFEFKEAVDALNIVSMGLATSSDNLPLITRGMIYISAHGNGQELSLAENTSLSITIPSIQNTETDMNVFYGEKNADGTINWKKDSSSFMKKVQAIPINISKKELAKVTIPIPEVHFTKYNEVLTMPRVPLKPYAPREPQIPDSNRYKYYLNDIEKAFWSKEKIKRKNAEVYSRVYKNYVTRQKRYESRMSELPEKIKHYNELYVQYQQDSTIYEQKIQERVNSVMLNLYSLKQRNIAKHFAALQRNLLEHPITSRTNFKDIIYRYHPAVNIDNALILEKILGREAFRYFFKGNNNPHLSERENYETRVNEYVNYSMQLHHGNIVDSLANTSGLKDVLNTMQTAWMDSMANLGLLNAKSFDGYVADVGRLGWINCDRFYNIPDAQKAIAKVNENDDATIYMVLQNEASFFKLNKTNEQYVSFNIPKHGNYKLIAVKMVDNKPMLAIREFNHLPKEAISLVYTEGSVERLKEELKSINTL